MPDPTTQETGNPAVPKTEEKPFSEKTPEEKYRDIARRVEIFTNKYRLSTMAFTGNAGELLGISGRKYKVYRDDTCAEWYRDQDRLIGDSMGVSFTSDQQTWALRLSMKGYFDKNNMLYYRDRRSGNNSSGTYRCMQGVWKSEVTVDVFEKFDELLKDLEAAPGQQ